MTLYLIFFFSVMNVIIQSHSIPGVEEITDFVTKLCNDTQMEYECMVISLIYVRRLVKRSDGKLELITENWRGIVLACILLSNKVWDDFHMKNADYCHVFKGLTIERVNVLEALLLIAIDHCCNVSPSVYARTHFEIQAMITLSAIELGRLRKTNTQSLSDRTLQALLPPKEDDSEVVGIMASHSNVSERRENDSTRLSVKEHFCDRQNSKTSCIPTLVFAGKSDKDNVFRNTRKVLDRSIDDVSVSRNVRVLVKYETCGLIRTPTDIHSPNGCFHLPEASSELENASNCSSILFPDENGCDNVAFCSRCMCLPFIRNVKIAAEN